MLNRLLYNRSSTIRSWLGLYNIHNFKDAKDGDLIKEKIYSELDYSDLWTDDMDILKARREKIIIFEKAEEFINPINDFLDNNESFDIEQKNKILNILIQRINSIQWYFNQINSKNEDKKRFT